MKDKHIVEIGLLGEDGKLYYQLFFDNGEIELVEIKRSVNEEDQI